MSLNSSSCASAINIANDNAITTWPSSTFASAFAGAYKSYSQAGVLSGGGGSAGSEDESILTSLLSAGQYVTDAEFGQALADYWATCMLVPAAGSVSVTNNASSKSGAFTAAVTASYSTTQQTPYYKHFIDNIEAVAKTIVWTCVKPNPLPPTSETIS